jgi:hypothetical protein
MRRSVTRLALVCLAAPMLAATPATAQEGNPFVKSKAAPTCVDNPAGNTCPLNFPAVPEGSRREITHVACRASVGNSPNSRLAAELHVVKTADQSIQATVPLVPINVGGDSSAWVVSQSVFVPLGQNRRPRISLHGVAGDIVPATALCSISGHTVPLS